MMSATVVYSVEQSGREIKVTINRRLSAAKRDRIVDAVIAAVWDALDVKIPRRRAAKIRGKAKSRDS